MSENLVKVYMTTGWDAKRSSQFVIIGITPNMDARYAHTERQISGFRLAVKFSKVFKGVDCKSNALYYLENTIRSKLIEYEKCNLFKEAYYINTEDMGPIVKELYSKLPQHEINIKEEVRQKYK